MTDSLLDSRIEPITATDDEIRATDPADYHLT